MPCVCIRDYGGGCKACQFAAEHPAPRTLVHEYALARIGRDESRFYAGQHRAALRCGESAWPDTHHDNMQRAWQKQSDRWQRAMAKAYRTFIEKTGSPPW